MQVCELAPLAATSIGEIDAIRSSRFSWHALSFLENTRHHGRLHFQTEKAHVEEPKRSQYGGRPRTAPENLDRIEYLTAPFGQQARPRHADIVSRPHPVRRPRMTIPVHHREALRRSKALYRIAIEEKPMSRNVICAPITLLE